jgi:hypothetical protein
LQEKYQISDTDLNLAVDLGGAERHISFKCCQCISTAVDLTPKNQASGFDVDMNYQVMSAPDEEK